MQSSIVSFCYTDNTNHLDGLHVIDCAQSMIAESKKLAPQILAFGRIPRRFDIIQQLRHAFPWRHQVKIV